MAQIKPEEFRVAPKDGIPGHRFQMRTCEVQDAELFKDLWFTVSGETTHTLQTREKEPELEKVRENWRATYEHAREVKIGVFEPGSGRLMGLIGFYVRGTHPWTAHIGMFGMFLRKEVWGFGLGRRFLELVEDHARSVGILKMETDVRTENERGIKLYTAMGYRIEGRRTRGALVDGRFHDEFYIAKDLV